MQTILFYEHSDFAKIEAACFEGGQLLWREALAKSALSEWLKTEKQGARLKKDAALVCVVEETAVARTILAVPQAARPQERRKMAENAIGLVLGEAPALLGLSRLEGEANGENNWLVTGVKKDAFQKWQKAFGAYAYRVKWVSALECALAFSEMPLARGVYALQAPLWTAVFAYEDGAVKASRAQEGRERMTLEMALFEETKDWGLAPYSVPLDIAENALLNQDALNEKLLVKTRAARAEQNHADHKLLLLIVGCMVLPGLIGLASTFREAQPREDGLNNGTVQSTVVTKSHYSSLIEGAYQAKSARIIILSQEASEGALAIHGRCSEVLDLADYMKNLENAQTPLHPLLLDMTKKSDKERYYYEFVLEISLEGREGHEGA